MTALELIRATIVIFGLVASLMWIRAGIKTKSWTLPILSLCWLIPVIVFFALRFIVTIDTNILNYISLGIYLSGVFILMGIAYMRGR